MRFSYFVGMENSDNRPYRDLWKDEVEQIRALDDAGFHTAWQIEHHFGGEGFDVTPNPLMANAYLAGVTSRIRLGVSAMIIPHWHPLRAAEDVALLDQMCDGRLELAVGRGILTREATNLNPIADRRNEQQNWRVFLETLEIMKRAWTEESLQFEGEFYRFPAPGVEDITASFAPRNPLWRSESGEYIGMSIIPKPLQKPHPRLYSVCDKTTSFVVAAQQDLLPLTWLRSREGLREALTTYQEASSLVKGRPMKLGEDVGVLRLAFVADTMEKARSIAEEAVELLYRNIAGGVTSRQIFANPDEDLSDADSSGSWFDFLFERDHLLIGTPDFVADKIQDLNENYGIEHIMTWMWLPGVSQKDVMRSIDLYASKVMPRFYRHEDYVPILTGGPTLTGA